MNLFNFGGAIFFLCEHRTEKKYFYLCFVLYGIILFFLVVLRVECKTGEWNEWNGPSTENGKRNSFIWNLSHELWSVWIYLFMRLFTFTFGSSFADSATRCCSPFFLFLLSLDLNTFSVFFFRSSLQTLH